MATNIVVPQLGESVLEATVAKWLKKEGEPVSPGDVLVELETDKVNLEVGAEQAGILSKIERKEGEDVRIGDVLGVIEQKTGEVAKAGQASTKSAEAEAVRMKEPEQPTESAEVDTAQAAAPVKASPSVRRFAQDQGVDLALIRGSGAQGQITRDDVRNYLSSRTAKPATAPMPEAPPTAEPPVSEARKEERKRMTRRRQTIARRLVEAQRNAAILTTFNEIDMAPVMELRKRHKESFKQKHGVGLGIVSFFVKAVIGALKDFPELNAEIEDDTIVYKHYYDIGIAVGAEEGLVVPVLRDADQMSFARIEQTISEFVRNVQEGTLSLEDLRGGTFSITNGGVFGSLLSTPILNPPQVGILGLHKIEERPIARDGQVVIRPMMYVALSYDHRIVDGRQSVQFLVRIKELIEDPASLLLES